MTIGPPAWVAREAKANLVYPTVDAWVTEWLSPTIRRPSAGRCWCPKWWAHPEAVSRLSALWQAWETLMVDEETGPSAWWLQHADPHLRVLLDRTGPFAACRSGHSDDLAPLCVEVQPTTAT